MKFKYIGDVPVINMTIGKRLAPGDVVEVDDPEKIKRFEYDQLYEAVEKAKPKRGDK